MRLRRAYATFVIAVLLGAALAACFDLFHSTAGIVTGCQLDAAACEDASSDARVDGATDFCGWPAAMALQQAQHACAWLGACETPMGDNAFGPCMVAALMAYNCDANPSHRPRGNELAFWDCLWKVQACGEVDRCLFPGGVPRCSATGFGCATNVRVACDGDAVAGGESCAMRGQTCVGARCSGGSSACGPDECTPDSRLHRCVDGGDVGIDCASNGAGICGGFPAADAVAWVACVAGGDAGCSPSLAAQCNDNVASSCPSGVAESVDCAQLLLTPDASCVAGNLDPPFDWTSPCAVVPPACVADSCDNAGLTGCTRGAPLHLDNCGAQGLGGCRMVATDNGTMLHAACTPPP